MQNSPEQQYFLSEAREVGLCAASRFIWRHSFRRSWILFIIPTVMSLTHLYGLTLSQRSQLLVVGKFQGHISLTTLQELLELDSASIKPSAKEDKLCSGRRVHNQDLIGLIDKHHASGVGGVHSMLFMWAAIPKGLMQCIGCRHLKILTTFHL